MAHFGSISLLKIIFKYMSQALLFIVFRGLEIQKKVEGNSNEKHLNLEPIPSHKESVTCFFFWHLLNLHLHLLFMLHGKCGLALYICSSYIYIYTSLYVLLKILKSNYKRKTSNDA